MTNEHRRAEIEASLTRLLGNLFAVEDMADDYARQIEQHRGALGLLDKQDADGESGADYAGPGPSEIKGE